MLAVIDKVSLADGFRWVILGMGAFLVTLVGMILVNYLRMIRVTRGRRMVWHNLLLSGALVLFSLFTSIDTVRHFDTPLSWGSIIKASAHLLAIVGLWLTKLGLRYERRTGERFYSPSRCVNCGSFYVSKYCCRCGTRQPGFETEPERPAIE